MRVLAKDFRRFKAGNITIIEFPGRSVFSALYTIPKHRQLVQTYLRRKHAAGIQYAFRYF